MISVAKGKGEKSSDCGRELVRCIVVFKTVEDEPQLGAREVGNVDLHADQPFRNAFVRAEFAELFDAHG